MRNKRDREILSKVARTSDPKKPPSILAIGLLAEARRNDEIPASRPTLLFARKA